MGVDTRNYGRTIGPDGDCILFPLSVPEPIENAVQPALPVPLVFPVIAPGSDDSHENEWLNSLTFLPENPVQTAHHVALAFPVIAPGRVDSREAATAYTDTITNFYRGRQPDR